MLISQHEDEAMAWLEKDFAGRNMSGLVYVASTVIHQRLRKDAPCQNLFAANASPGVISADAQQQNCIPAIYPVYPVSFDLPRPELRDR